MARTSAAFCATRTEDPVGARSRARGPKLRHDLRHVLGDGGLTARQREVDTKVRDPGVAESGDHFHGFAHVQTLVGVSHERECADDTDADGSRPRSAMAARMRVMPFSMSAASSPHGIHPAP